MDCVRLLIENGADVNKASKGMTPLFIASQMGNVECVRLLEGALINNPNMDNDASSLVDSASKGGHSRTAELLREADGDVSRALFLACKKGDFETACVLFIRGRRRCESSQAL